MKHFKQLLLAMLVALTSSLQANAEDFEVDGIYYSTSTSTNTCSVIHQDGIFYSGNIIIPSTVTYKGLAYSVTGIESQAFASCKELNSVVIPNSIRALGEGAFQNSSIKSLTIPSSIAEIPRYTFRSCSKLESVEIPSTVTRIDASAFASCACLKSIVIPNSVTFLSYSAFSNCTSLTSAVVGSSYIGQYMFSGCSNLSYVEFTNSPTEIYGYAFRNCVSLKDIVIPSSITNIQESAFEGCTGLTSVCVKNEVPGNITLGSNVFNKVLTDNCILYVPEGSENIYAKANQWKDFKNIESFINVPTEFEADDIRYKILSLEDMTCEVINKSNAYTGFVEIPERVFYGGYSFKTVSVANNAFSGNTSLTEISLPITINSIGQEAFLNCSRLAKISAHSLISEVGERAFYGCSGLLAMDLHLTTPPIENKAWVQSWAPLLSKESFVVFVPKEAVSAYKNASGWEQIKHLYAIGETVIVDRVRFANKYEEENSSVTYIRNFTSANWQPLYIPFNMSYNEWSEYAAVAEIRGIYAYDDSEGVEHTILAFHRLSGGELKPNTPYVIKPKQTGEVTFSCTNKTLKAAENSSVWCASTRQKFTLTGVYQETPIRGKYALINGSFYQMTSDAPQHPFRFYLTVEDVNNGYGTGSAMHAPQKIQMMVDGEMATGIDGIAESDSSSLFDLSGRQVARPQHGIYIKNGKKVFVK